MICDEDQFLDPLIFYRIIEVVFDVNLFVYGSLSEEEKSSKNDKGQMLLPRHKIYHSQPYREKPTILILRNWGGATDALVHPQSELIIQEIRGANPIMLFKPEMGKINYNVMLQTSKTIIWKFGEGGKLEAHSNFYDPDLERYTYPDYHALINFQGIRQIIDDYGKMRGLVFYSESGEEVTMFFDPSQPVNLPLALEDRIYCKEEQEFDTPNIISECKVDTATSIFGEPRFTVKNPEGKTEGLWFGKEVKVYIPVSATKKYVNLPVGDPNPFETQPDDSVERLEKMKRDLDFIQQILWYLYLVYRNTTKGANNKFDQFVSNYLDYKEFKGDSAYYYNLLGFKRNLPEGVRNVEEALEILEEEASEEDEPNYLISDGKVHFYNYNFYEKMVKWLNQKVQLQIVNELPPIPKVIERYFLKAEDFKAQEHVNIFIGKTELKKWLESNRNSSQIHHIYTSIEPKLTLMMEPFIFQDIADSKIYLIQNVVNGELDRALHVAYVWMLEKRNIGSNVSPATIDYPYRIYGESTSGLAVLEEHIKEHEGGIATNIPILTLVTKGKESFERLDYLRIIQYNQIGKAHFAAMLDLL
jgi:hypothetical protein